MHACVTLAMYRENAALVHRARYCLGHTHEVIICRACKGASKWKKARTEPAPQFVLESAFMRCECRLVEFGLKAKPKG